MGDAVQTLLDDRYELNELIDRGGMAEVYRATDRRLGRTVAVKIVDLHEVSDPSLLERFRREARAVARLNHPNICAVYDWGTSQTGAYMVMELIPGHSLKTLLEKRGRLPEDEALDIAAQTATALGKAHDEGVVHRDVKPQNILITPAGQVKVIDFGIARAFGAASITTSDAVSGTPHYMSPEQARLEPVDARSDLYSLGIVLYEMLIGSPPFTGDSMVSVALQHINSELPNPLTAAPDLSPLTVQLLHRAVAKVPEQRFASAAEMAAAISAVRGVNVAEPTTQPAQIPRLPDSGPATAPVEMTAKVASPPVPLREKSARSRAWIFAVPVVIAAGLVIAIIVLTRSPGHRAMVTAKPRVTPTLHAVVPTRPPATPAAHTAPTTASVPPTSGPVETVRTFYADIIHGRYSDAATLWSAAMQARCPPYACINQRFRDTTVAQLPSLSLNQSTSTSATVSVDLIETNGTDRRHYVGTWYLVPSGEHWLMDNVSLHCLIDPEGNYCPPGST